MTTRQLILLLVILIGIGILVTAGQLLLNKPTSAIPSPTVTIEPVSTTTNRFTLALGQKGGNSEVAVTPINIIEDSRCGINVVCIWAGTVRIRAELASANLNTTSQTIEQNKPLSVGNRTLTLVEVQPSAYAGREIASGDYRFTFEIK